MNERPTTRIVAQKGIDTLHLQGLMQQHGGRASSAGSSGYHGWDSRSIATQTSQDEDEEEERQGSSKGGGRRGSRWHRHHRSAGSSSKRKSIAVMQEVTDREVERLSRAKSSSPTRQQQRRRQSMSVCRSASAVPMPMSSGSVDDLLAGRGEGRNDDGGFLDR